jgi:hypothetical protein
MAEWVSNCLMVIMGSVYVTEVVTRRFALCWKPVRVAIERFTGHDYCACALGLAYILSGVYGH